MITTATTLAELEALRLQHNVQSITMHKVCGFGMPPGILVVLETLTECRYFGSGPDISEALASAFARVAPRMASDADDLAAFTEAAARMASQPTRLVMRRLENGAHTVTTQVPRAAEGPDTAITITLSPTAHHNLRELLAFFDRVFDKAAQGLPFEAAFDTEALEHYRNSLTALRPTL